MEKKTKQNEAVEIRWHGRGGQGAKTACLLLADVAFNSGKHVQGFPEYGPERMGAPITAYNRITDEPSKVHSNIYHPDYVVVVDETLDEEAFRLAVAAVRTGMEQDEIRCSMGFSWRSVPCSLREQFDEADFLMYQEKRRFYGAREHDRRKQS